MAFVLKGYEMRLFLLMGVFLGLTASPSVAQQSKSLQIKLLCDYDRGGSLIVRVDQRTNRMSRVIRLGDQSGWTTDWFVEFNGNLDRFGGRVTPSELVIADTPSAKRVISRQTLVLREYSGGSIPVSSTGRCRTAPWDGIEPRLPARQF